MDQIKQLNNPSFLPIFILALSMLPNYASLACAFGKLDAWKSFNHVFFAEILKIYLVEVSKPLMPYIIGLISM